MNLFARSAWFFVILTAVAPALAPSARAELARLVPISGKERIQGLVWEKGNEIPIEVEGTGDNAQFHATLSGRMLRDGWKLTWNSEGRLQAEVPLSGEEREFTIDVQLAGPSSEIELHALGPKGAAKSESIRIEVAGWDALKARTRMQVRRPRLIPSLGFTLVSYRQTNVKDILATLATWKVTYVQPLPPQRWDLGVTSFVTLVPISSTGTPLRYLGVNLRLGYSLPGIAAPWAIGINTGVYYTTMLLRATEVGFQNLIGPQLFTTVRRTLDSTDTLTGYLKYAPVSNSGGIVLENREFALGVGWVRALSTGNSVSFNLDLATLFLRDVVNRATISSDSASISAGYAF